MRTWVVLSCGISLLIMSFWTLFYGYTQKVGAIANGPNDFFIWFQFSIFFISGILVLSCSIFLKNKILRLFWIIPNVICYLMFIGFSTFVIVNFEGLKEINRLSIWVIAMLSLLIVSIFGSFRIRNWIKEGKL